MLKKVSLVVCTLVATMLFGTMNVKAAEDSVSSKNDLYNTIKNSVMKHEDTISINIRTAMGKQDVVNTIQRATDLNYQTTSTTVKTTWCDGFHLYYETDNNGYITYVKVTPVYNTSKSSDKAVDEYVAKWVNIYLEDIDDDAEKVEIIHDWIIKKITYNGSLNSDGQYMYRSASVALLDGVGVCTSYATLFQKMCEYAGINCVTYYDTISLGRHAWNYVNIDGYWYGVDCTFDDPDNGNRVNYDYFLTNNGHLGSNAPFRVYNYYY